MDRTGGPVIRHNLALGRRLAAETTLREGLATLADGALWVLAKAASSAARSPGRALAVEMYPSSILAASDPCFQEVGCKGEDFAIR